MKKISTTIIAAGLLCAAPLAMACGMKGCPQGGWMQEQMDSNKDGVVSKKEYDAFHSDHFKQLDANKDGKVSQDEMDAFHKRMTDKCQPRYRYEDRFKEVDVDGDGKLSKDEAEIGMPMVFAHFDDTDTDKDGKISREELDASMKGMHEKMRDKCIPKKDSDKK